MLSCPSPHCRGDNAADAETCARCTLPLAELADLQGQHARLFNQGLAAGKAGRLQEARDLFSAVVHWCPHDHEARNALALAAFRLGDRETARRSWTTVLDRAASNPLAKRGLDYLARVPPEVTAPPEPRAGGVGDGARRRTKKRRRAR